VVAIFNNKSEVDWIGWPTISGGCVKGDMVRRDKNAEESKKSWHNAVYECTVQYECNNIGWEASVGVGIYFEYKKPSNDRTGNE
jgi:hypothetical protein